MTEFAVDAVVLAGGQGERLGGTDKAMLEVGGEPLLSRVIAATESLEHVVVVGPRRPGFERVFWTVEEPAGGGPSAGIVAGLRVLAGLRSSSVWVIVLAVDQPGIAAVLPILVAAAEGASADVDAVCPYDQEGHPQWLLAAYRAESLHRACAAVGTGHDVSVGQLVRGLQFGPIAAPLEHIGDIDTWADHRAWQDRWES